MFLTSSWFLCRKVRRILLAIVTTMTLSSTPKTWPRSTSFFHTPTDVSYLKNRNWIPLSMLRWACWCQGFWKDHLRGKPYHIRYVLSLCARQKHSNLWLDCRIFFWCPGFSFDNTYKSSHLSSYWMLVRLVSDASFLSGSFLNHMFWLEMCVFEAVPYMLWILWNSGSQLRETTLECFMKVSAKTLTACPTWTRSGTNYCSFSFSRFIRVIL